MEFIKMKVTYTFANGEIKEIETTKEIYDLIEKDTQEVKNQNRRETRRHTSYNVLELYDLEPFVEVDYLQKIDLSALHKAIKTLEPKQKDLVRRVFLFGG
jgi:DNA-directed RNA polymerase specialized sigma24 family protein